MIGAENLRYAVADFNLDVSLTVADAEYFVLFGMTGCGKTSLLECLCGLRHVSSGRICVAGQDVTRAAPRVRQVGYVPQDGALFAHLTVRENLAFALRVGGAGRAERDSAVNRVAERLGIAPLLERRIRGLSGGEQQRVALGRALAGRPRALLLDEPVSALDEFTRDAVCAELIGVQKETGIAVVHVCHSFEEAARLADRIGMMREGRIVQTGTAAELARAPRDAYVARILRLENVFSGVGVRDNGTSHIRMNGFHLRAEVPEGPVGFMVRSADIGIGPGPWPPDGTRVVGPVSELAFEKMGVKLRLGGPLPLTTVLSRREAATLRLAIGAEIELYVPASAVHLLAPSA